MHKMLRVIAIFAIVILASFAFPLGLSAQSYAYVANHQSNTLSVIDTTSDSAVATVTVEHNAYGVAITP